MKRRGIERLAPLTGVLFLILFAVVFVLGGDEPDSDAKLAKVVAYWTDHDGREMTTSIVATYAAVSLVWFAGSLRATLWRAEGGNGRVSTLAFAGAVMQAVGVLIFAGIGFAAADTAGDVSPQVTQTLSVLNSDFFLPLAAGTAIFFLATGVSALRSGGLPRALAWIALLIGVISLTPLGFFGLLAGSVWVGITGVILFLREPEAAAAPAPAAPQA